MATPFATSGVMDAQVHTSSGGERWQSLLAVQIVMMITAATAVALRFISRRIGPRELWWDDWVILAALVPFIAGCITDIVAIHYGLGWHLWEAPNHGLEYAKTVIPVAMLFSLAMGLAKGSVLLLYKRIFSLDSHTSYWVNIVAAIIISWCLTLELVLILQCRPLSAFWDASVEGQCLNFRQLNRASAIGHIITTVIVITLPQPLIWKLHMSLSKKLAYSGICCLGITTAIASIGRIITVDTLPVHAILSGDFTWYAPPAIIWYTIEPSIGILCACLPCIGPIFRKNQHHSNQKRRSKTPFSRSSQLGSEEDGEDTRISDADDASMLRRLGATCEVSIYTAARENMSGHYFNAHRGSSDHGKAGDGDERTPTTPQARRRGTSEGPIYVRNSTHID